MPKLSGTHLEKSNRSSTRTSGYSQVFRTSSTASATKSR
nr:MAG TPA: hypothetical protein [Caudoviricetes sp.]